jgi:hypothetical protein
MLEDVRAGREAWRKYASKDVCVASEELPCITAAWLLSSSVVKSDVRERELARALVEGVATVESSSE